MPPGSVFVVTSSRGGNRHTQPDPVHPEHLAQGLETLGVPDTLLQMGKIDIAGLEAAYRGE